ncbi:MAG: acetyl-CoA carboxylase, biotin carboxyl carrier protein, partial [Pseudomonadota bacterium]
MTKNTEQDVAFIKALADLLNDSDLGEIEVERSYGDDDELKVRLSRATSAPLPVIAAPAPSQVAVAAPAAAPAPAASTPQAAATDDAPDLSNAVTSPMVGTVYLAAEPGSAPFVTAG